MCPVSKHRNRPHYPKKIFRRWIPLNPIDEVNTKYLFFDRGLDKTLLFIHGWGLKLSSWKYQMDAFDDYNLLFVDNRGHDNVGLGLSTPKTYLTDCAKDIIGLLSYLKISNYSVITHSMGTLIALEMDRLIRDSLYLHTNIPGMPYSYPHLPTKYVFTTPVLSNPLSTFPLSNRFDSLVNKIAPSIISETGIKLFELYLSILNNKVGLKLLHFSFREITETYVGQEQFNKYVSSLLDIKPEGFVIAFQSMMSEGDRIGSHFDRLNQPILILLGQSDFFVDSRKVAARVGMHLSTQVRTCKNATHFPQAERYEDYNKIVSQFINF